MPYYNTSCAYAINNSGQVVGESGTTWGTEHAFLATIDTMTDNVMNINMTDLGTSAAPVAAPTGLTTKGKWSVTLIPPTVANTRFSTAMAR